MDGEEPIFLWWIGEREVDPALMDHLRQALVGLYDIPVALWEGRERPSDAYDARRKQWASGKVLKWLLEAGPGGGRLLGITDQDLFIPILTYVFGEAQLGGRVAVVSTARLMEDVELAGPQLLEDRLVKEAVHELGHVFGLMHCATPVCVMGRSGGVRDVDSKRAELCEECRARLWEARGGN
jgi:archaemetzincin